MITSVYANARYDLEALLSLRLTVQNFIADIQVIEALLDEEKKSYSLASLSKDYGLPPKTRDKIESMLPRIGHKPNWSMLWKLPVDVVGEYAKYDAEATYKIYQLQKPKIVAEELTEVVELEAALAPVLLSMRMNGVPVDIPRAEEENARLFKEGEELLETIRRDSPKLNPFSPLQLGEYIRELGYFPETTEKGNDSVSNEYLLASNDDRLKIIGKYRQQEKIRRDFIEGMILQSSYKGHLHPQWFQTRGSSFMSGDDTGGTRSGRIACANPNLSQIPSRHPVLGKLVRSLFIPSPGNMWFKGDLSQQEPRISLHYAYLLKLTGAEEARQAYLDDPHLDYHTLTRNMVNKVSVFQIDRNQAKTINLGVAYGMGIQKLANGLGLPRNKAQTIIDNYHRGFPFMKELLYKAQGYAEARGYVKTVLGRRRHFDMWEPPYFQRGKFPIRGKAAAIAAYGPVKQANTYRAMNSIVQGSAAEQMKKMLIELYAEKIPIYITLYDELGAPVADEATAKRIKEIAENVIQFEVPQVMEYKLQKTWAKE
jgi:DNA polymerase I-like protein with 3'-5' exonuclease and polymerase domains